ncbi:hypothetical protein CANINC_001734 [Pichia inconspicua]|uniref:DNA-(apurinic or apyrimidinic site) lyase n=1 Tax=Pichia inconspicua TaxID=52247 RepID=A0A4T0X372_9ASCO|nr:hypothetical protein CANINC_001734 [[Candida] inconspicua]
MLWRKLVAPKFELDIPTLLRSGQAFRWRKIDEIWSCALNDQIVLIRESHKDGDQIIEYSHIDSLNPQINVSLETGEFLYKYFNLDQSTSDLYQHWAKIDSHFPTFHKSTTMGILETPPNSERQTPIDDDSFNGVRILSQDPWETLISFIISSNNNIKRISQLCEILCISYGQYVNDFNNIPYYTFPQPNDFFRNSKLITSFEKVKLENELRQLGFGYRAKYITKTVSAMIESPALFEKLHSGSWNTDEECLAFLRQFDGVGPKVADCVALMGCHRDDLVPVDTHVWKVLRNTYRDEFNYWVDVLDSEELIDYTKSNLKKALGNKSVDTKVYPFVKQFFKEFWKKKAGWAQAVVFSSIVKLDNGINSEEDVKKLIAKVSEIEGDIRSFKRIKRE